jgi:hypothetical protein
LKTPFAFLRLFDANSRQFFRQFADNLNQSRGDRNTAFFGRFDARPDRAPRLQAGLERVCSP